MGSLVEMPYGVNKFLFLAIGFLLSTVTAETRRKRWSSQGSGAQGACSSNHDCPRDNPVCSEHGFCQCASYRRGGADCWRQGGGGWSGGSTQPTCSTNSHCPPSTPVCSGYGFCQCASYRRGGPECWRQGGSQSSPAFGGGSNGLGGGNSGGCNNCWRKKREAVIHLIEKYQQKN